MDHDCKFEGKVMKMAEDIAETKGDVKALSIRINGSYDTFYDHIKQGKGWRTAVMSSILLVVINIVIFSYLFGIVNKTVLVNERIIQRILMKYEQIVGEER